MLSKDMAKSSIYMGGNRHAQHSLHEEGAILAQGKMRMGRLHGPVRMFGQVPKRISMTI
jgi:hypothetical protein